jgi:hypothetical protein
MIDFKKDIIKQRKKMHQNKSLVVMVQFLFIFFFAINISSYAQEKNNTGFNLAEHQNKSSYRDIERLLFRKEYSKVYPEYGISTLNGKKELWEVSSLDNGKQILIIESYDDGAYYREVYYSKNGVLLYAIDSDRYIKENALQSDIWECEFFIKDGKIYSEVSLGHGKTERDDWDPNVIFKMFETRKMELKKLQQ